MSETETVPDDGCVASWCAGDDWWAITCTMSVIGGKWHPVMVERLLEDWPLRFNELAGALGPITNKVLSNGLEDLEAADVVERRVLEVHPVAVEYALTERGRSLEPVIRALAAWGSAHLGDGHSSAESAR